jgi:hypothetical protein
VAVKYYPNFRPLVICIEMNEVVFEISMVNDRNFPDSNILKKTQTALANKMEVWYN